MKKITVGINGAAGRMGLALVRMITQSNDSDVPPSAGIRSPQYRTSGDLQLLTAIDNPENPRIGEDIGIIAGIGRTLGVKLSADLDKPTDVVIDFSSPAGAMRILKSCLKYKSGLVVGTTGLTKSQINRLRQAGKKIPCLISPNMSLGANLLFKIAPEIALMLGSDYDIEITETHHRFKKDAPSGTAIRLAQNITSKTGRKIPIHSLRLGDVVGDHNVIFSTLGERIELTHRVHTRDIFVRGALAAARFLAKSKPGLYTIQDML